MTAAELRRLLLLEGANTRLVKLQQEIRIVQDLIDSLSRAETRTRGRRLREHLHDSHPVMRKMQAKWDESNGVTTEHKGGRSKGFSYKGKHWMQLPKNRAKMLKRVRALQRANKAQRKKTVRKGPHWTQTPEGKAKMAEVQKKAWVTRKAKEGAAE